ncbi:MAG: DUF1289 domain-containing protein [Candidatus Puniceispirillales bacterium]|mgnify:CR=1 FL=1|jgi:predicted Fe-S protein YdhL (DUF1289 family)|tara:strand:- start:1214 stop:1411 length:198 start_codon:yes stop_codon:yes gene_type:complete
MKENNYLKKISPCIGVCELDLESDLCVGCLRTSQEIAIWSQIDNTKAMQIMEETKNRTLFKKVLL